MLRRLSPTSIVVAATVALLALHVTWFRSHRTAGPFFVDEAGYTVYSIRDARALEHHGLSGLWDAYRTQRVFAPLVPLLSMPAQRILGPGVGRGWLVVAAAFAGLVVLTYVVARRLTTPGWAAVAAIATACTPDVIRFTRMYYFAVPAALFYVAGIVMLLRSDALARWRPAIAAGALFGLATLSRTMLLGLVVGPVLAIGLQALVSSRDALRRRLLHGALMVGVGAAVAATWYVDNLGGVLEYLRRGAVKSRAVSRGVDGAESVAPGRPSRLEQLAASATRSLNVPLTIVVVGVGIGAVVMLVRARPSVRRRIREVVSTPHFLVGVSLAEAIVALTFARNALGEWVPAVPLVLALATAALSRMPRKLAVTGGAALLVIGVLNLMAAHDIGGVLTRPRSVELGFGGALPLFDGRSYVEVDLERNGWFVDSTGHMPARFREWNGLNTAVVTAARVQAKVDKEIVVMFLGPEDTLMNTNSLLLADRVENDFRPIITGRFSGPVAAQLDDPRFGLPNAFVVYERPGRRLARALDLGELLEDHGFEIIGTWRPSTGGRLVLRWRPQREAVQR